MAKITEIKISAKVTVGTVSVTTNATIPFTTVVFDTNRAVTLATGRFTALKRGVYRISTAGNRTATGGNTIVLYKNNLLETNLCSFSAANGTYATGSTLVFLNFGDFIDLRIDGNVTLNALEFSIESV